LHPKKRREDSGGFRRTTNNRMEIYAAIAGLEILKEPCKVTLYSDSQYLVDAIMKGWAVSWKKKNWWRFRPGLAQTWKQKGCRRNAGGGIDSAATCSQQQR